MRLRFLLLVLSLLATAAFAATRRVEQSDVFVSGQDGYHTYRIPAIIRAANGALLAFAEGRKSAGGDTGDIDLLLKRSTDGGLTWSAQQVIWDDGLNTCGNPCAVVDASNGAVWLLLTHNLGTDHEKDIVTKKAKSTRTVWVTHSRDHGATWAKPTEITSTTKDPAWGWYATGPGVGIQIKHGPHAGRLVIPCDHSYDDPAGKVRNGPYEYGSHSIFSDDHGRTWQRGGVIRPKVNECQVAELFDGRGTLLMDMRSYFGRSRRTHALSSDGGKSWTAPKDVEALVEPICQASLLRHEPNLLVFSNPADPKTRVRLTVKASADNAQTWREIAVLENGPSAYSCLVSVDSATVGCLYERGEKRPYDRITFARLPLGAP